MPKTYSLNKFWHPAGDLLPRRAQTVVTLLILLFFLYKTEAIFKPFLFPDVNGYGYTEMLIDYGGGFVRRGMLGDLIHRLAAAAGISPLHIIRPLCMAAFVAVAAFFFSRFRRLGLNWWLLASPLLFGSLTEIIRKDFMLVGLLMVVYFLLRERKSGGGRIICAILLLALGIFLHEAFLFWGTPVALLLLLSRRETRLWGAGGTLLLVGLFSLMSAFKGTMEQTLAIIEGWRPLPGMEEIKYQELNALGALAWDMRQTFANHLYNNFCMGYSPWLVVPVRLLMMMLIYYLLSNFLFTFRKINRDTPGSEKTAFSALLLFSLFCLLPMFTILSCDYGRIYQYAAFSTVGAFVILGRERLAGLFPQGLLRGVARLNARLARLVSPRPWLMVAMLVLVASSPACFSPWIAAKQSILGSLIYYTHYAAKLL